VREHASISLICVAPDFLSSGRQQTAQQQVAARQILKVQQANKHAMIVCPLWSQVPASVSGIAPFPVTEA
jgi:hypothetical protein